MVLTRFLMAVAETNTVSRSAWSGDFWALGMGRAKTLPLVFVEGNRFVANPRNCNITATGAILLT
jgi:hypothetical protein